jgi:hypothetical protein
MKAPAIKFPKDHQMVEKSALPTHAASPEGVSVNTATLIDEAVLVMHSTLATKSTKLNSMLL